MRTRRHTVLEVVAWLLLLVSYGVLHTSLIKFSVYTLYMTIMSYRQDARYAILSVVIFLAVLGTTTVGATVRAYYINQQ